MASNSRYEFHINMAKEKKENGNVISRRFSTMMPLDVLIDFTKFAKETTKTGLGKFDYSVALRILLDRSKIQEKIDSLEDHIDMLEMKINESNGIVSETVSPITFRSAEKGVKDDKI